MAKITAKAKLGAKTQQANGDWHLYFYPDYYGDKAEINKAWATSTPSLMFQLNVRTEVADKFEANGSYTVTFEADAKEEVKDVSDSTA